MVKANRAAAEAAGRVVVGEPFQALTSTPPADVAAFVRRCTGTGSQVIGAFEMPGRDGIAKRLRAYGGRIVDLSGAVLVAIRLSPPSASEFALLSRKMDELNAEIRQRRQAQAVLEEALVENQALLRELHHRVKNNVQFMLGLLATRRREPGPPELGAFIDSTSQRLLAIGAAQHLMYDGDERRTVPAAEFVARISEAAAAAVGPDVRLTVHAAAFRVQNDRAFPLALIINELVVNAARHGARGNGAVRVDLLREEETMALAVSDDGPGFHGRSSASGRRRSSGLSLVRGLCGQIGARLSFDDGPEGATVFVRFPAECRGADS